MAMNTSWKIPLPQGLVILFSAILYFTMSSIKFSYFKATAFDLGIFDQAVYLISKGIEPVSSFLGFHILGDHASFILYPISLLYLIYPDVHWLLGLQAISLALGAVPVYLLAIENGSKLLPSTILMLIYLLNSSVFALLMFDFHPDSLAVPTFIWAVLFAKRGAKNKDSKLYFWLFLLAILIILSSKEVLALSVISMGIWLIFFEKNRAYGASAVILGLAWFLISTQIVIPFYHGDINRHFARFYGHLGGSGSEILGNFFLNPNLLLNFLKSNLKDILIYITQLLSPFILILSFKEISPLVGAIPILLMTILSQDPIQRDFQYYYVFPALPFIIVAVASTKLEFLKWSTIRYILSMAIAVYLMQNGSRLQEFTSSSIWEYKETLYSTNRAIEIIHASDYNNLKSILTAHQIAPHLTHRKIIQVIRKDFPLNELRKYDYIFLNRNYPDIANRELSKSTNNRILDACAASKEFSLEFSKNETFLYRKIS